MQRTAEKSISRDKLMNNVMTDIHRSVEFLRTTSAAQPRIAVVLGSGLGDFAQLLSRTTTVATADIPDYPVSTVHGHEGKIIFGRLENRGRTSLPLMVFQGRVHLYESNDIRKVVYPIHTAAAMGAEYVIVTNAAGGINRHFEPGTLMFINDLINLTGESPLRGSPGINSILHRRTTPIVDPELLRRAKVIATENGIMTREGVYCWTKGPTYETAAEIRMMESLGADAVGMSTVPEMLVAHQSGMKVLGISCITNMATGISATKLSHDEVTETANRVKQQFTTLVSEILFDLSR